MQPSSWIFSSLISDKSVGFIVVFATKYTDNTWNTKFKDYKQICSQYFNVIFCEINRLVLLENLFILFYAYFIRLNCKNILITNEIVKAGDFCYVHVLFNSVTLWWEVQWTWIISLYQKVHYYLFNLSVIPNITTSSSNQIISV